MSTFMLCSICGNYDLPTEENKCKCCKWSFNSILVVADLKQVNELCTNVFKYAHSLFLEQINAIKANKEATNDHT